MTKSSFKKFVKNAAKNQAFEYLLKKKERHSKMDNLTYLKFEIQQYLNSNFIYPKLAQHIFK